MHDGDHKPAAPPRATHGREGLSAAEAAASSSRSRATPPVISVWGPEVWGVLNVTPDSFSDGGRYLARDAAIERAKRMLAEGASVIDVGAASSRPRGQTYGEGAEAVSPEVEVTRALPIVEVLARELGARVSIDTTRAATAEAALQAGARIVNDVSMGADPALLRVVAAHDAELVLMHTREDGAVTPRTTRYRDVVTEVIRELSDAIVRAELAGIPRARLWVDPGLGFAKTPEQSAIVLARCRELGALETRVLIGASRKAFLGMLVERGGKRPEATERLGASVAAAIVAARGGARAVRVHDVVETRQALDVIGRLEPRHA